MSIDRSYVLRETSRTTPAGNDDYLTLSQDVRREILDLLHRTKSAHVGPSFSIVELLVALYFKVLFITPNEPFNPDRDRFILSKGHGCPALYTVLAARGYMKQEDISGFATKDGCLEQHPNRQVEKGIEVSTGSLGHGLSIAAGMALSGKRDTKTFRVYTLLGDGELNEGAVWEAAMFSAHQHLDNLIAVVDCNGIQALGNTADVLDLEPLATKWAAFGWAPIEIDGHDFTQIFSAFDSVPFSPGKPSVIIARTKKGKGVCFMEDKLLWHYRVPDDEEYVLALKELTE